MIHASASAPIERLNIYNLADQQQALEQLFECAANQWSLDTQDVCALLGLPTPDWDSGRQFSFSVPLPLAAQRSLYELLKLCQLLRSLPTPKAYDCRWLMTPNSLLADMAPIDLMLAEEAVGIRKVHVLIKNQTTPTPN